MNLLVDSSGGDLRLALAEGGTVLAEYASDPSSHQVEEVSVATSNLLKKVLADVDSIVAVGVVVGPGSMAGLRAGVTFAKVLAEFIGATVVPVGSAEAMAAALQSRSSGPVAVLRRVRKAEAFATAVAAVPEAIVRVDGPTSVVDPSNLAIWLDRCSERLGQDFNVLSDRLPEVFELRRHVAPDRVADWLEVSKDLMVQLARLVEVKILVGEAGPASSVAIDYVRGADVRISFQTRSESGEIKWVKS